MDKIALRKKNKDVIEESEVEMIDFFQDSLNDYDKFEEEAWKKGQGYIIPSFPIMTELLEGLEAGFYLFAGESNGGKTAAMLNIIYDVCSHPENNLVGLYFSLDDSQKEVIPRIIAMNEQIPIGVCSKPQRYQTKIDNSEENSITYQEYLEKRQAGLEKLKDNNQMFKIIDSNTVNSAEKIYDYIKKFKLYLKALYPEKNIIVGIDALNDIRFDSKNYSDQNELNTEISKTVKRWSVEFNIPIFGSCHLRKLNQNRRPVSDDLKNSSQYRYDASVTWLVYNDVSKNKGAANIYYSDENTDDKMPIIELDWDKNKKSSFKGRTYNYFVPNYSHIRECEAEVMDRYNQLVYSI